MWDGAGARVEGTRTISIENQNDLPRAISGSVLGQFDEGESFTFTLEDLKATVEDPDTSLDSLTIYDLHIV